jgi:hypothetical protein
LHDLPEQPSQFILKFSQSVSFSIERTLACPENDAVDNTLLLRPGLLTKAQKPMTCL